MTKKNPYIHKGFKCETCKYAHYHPTLEPCNTCYHDKYEPKEKEPKK